jgi:hypothetical protein
MVEATHNPVVTGMGACEWTGNWGGVGGQHPGGWPGVLNAWLHARVPLGTRLEVRGRGALISGTLPREFFEATQNPVVIGIGARE